MPVSSQPCPLIVEKAMKRPGFGNTVRVPLTLINTHLVTIEMLSLWAIGSIKPTCSDIKSSWSLGLKKTLHGPNFSLQIFAKVPAPSCDTSQIFLPDGVSSHRFWRLVLLLPPWHEGPVLSWCLVDLPEIYWNMTFVHSHEHVAAGWWWITNQVSRTGSAEGSIPTSSASSLSWRPKLLASKTVYNPHGCSIGCTFLSQNGLEIAWLMSNRMVVQEHEAL